MPRLSLNALAFSLLLVTSVFAQEVDNDIQKRGDSFKTYRHMRNGHACIMSIVFCVLYPLGAISIHLPISSIPVLRNTYLVKKVPAIHMPIQLLGLVMMIGGLGLGIRIAEDLGYFESTKYVKGHMVIGLLVACIIILFQPILGFLQHRYFKQNGKTSLFGHAHRWIGRFAIILGIVNDGLGLRLAEDDVVVPKSSYIRNFVIAGILVLIWASLAVFDLFRTKRETKVVGKGNGVVGDESHKVVA